MKKALLALLGAALFVCALVPVGRGSVASAAQPSPVPTYCSPPIAIVAGHEAKAAEIQSDLQHAEQCSGQYGDIYTDGPLYNSTVGFSGSSLSVTFPKNIVVVLGQRVYVAQSSQTVPANATSYWFLDAATGAWSSSLTNSPPTSTSELQYSVVATSSGVSSVTYGTALSSTPVYASLILSGSATASDLTATNQSGHNGFMATFNANGQLIATATPTPASLLCPAAGSNVTVTGTYPCAVAAVTPTPAPTPSPIAGTGITVTGAYPYTITSTATGGVSSLVAGQNITLTPSGGTGNVTVADTVTPGPQATPSPTPTGCGTWTGSWPYTNDTTACAGLNYADEFTQGVTMDASPNPPQVIASPTAAPASCPGNASYPTPGPAATFCVGSPTNTIAVVIGKVTGGWNSVSTGATASNSGGLCFTKNGGTAVDGYSCIGITSGNTLVLNGIAFGGGSATAISTGNTNFTAGTGTLTGGVTTVTKLLQNATKNYAGQCATSSSTTCTATITASFTTPICFAQDITTLVLAKCTVSGTTVTVTLASSETADTVNFLVIGNPT